MKKVGIITIFNSNYGNRLQNYALQQFLIKKNYEVTTIKNVSLLNKYNSNFEYFLRRIKYLFKKQDFIDTKEREQLFIEFNKYINKTKYVFNWKSLKKLNEFDAFVVGSDQVWNPYIGRLSLFDVAGFKSDKPKISYAASIGVKQIAEEHEQRLEKYLKEFKAVSVREETAQQILLEKCGLNSDVVIDPTMLLSEEEWIKVAKQPKQYKHEKYILNYFLGEQNPKTQKAINEFAKREGCKIINLLDKDDPYYETGPSEFLFLEKNAFLICTDSFHSSIFALLFNRPFVVFERHQNNHKDMNSRIEELLNTFNIINRKFDSKKDLSDYLELDYGNAMSILDEERKKSEKFLINNLR